jgi:3-methyladenine DNA glycosylase AlkD
VAPSDLRMAQHHRTSEHTRSSANSVRVTVVLAWLARHGSERNRVGMARYGIRPRKAFGVSMATMRPLVRRLGRDHALAQALWRTGWHEARALAALVDSPPALSVAQMDRWCRDFDNWAVCDTACIHLFSRSPLAWGRVRAWSRQREEFVRRAAFALVAGLAVHDAQAPDDRFLEALSLVELAAGDDRNFVKKAVNWALRQIGKRNRALHAAAVAVAERLAASNAPASRWIGRDALRELTGAAVRVRLRRTRRATAGSVG